MGASRRDGSQEEQFYLEVEEFALNEEDMKEQYTYAPRAIEQMHKLRLTGRLMPKYSEIHESIFEDIESGQYFDGRLPIVLKKLSMDQLSALLSLFSNWYGYLIQQLGIVAAERSEAKRQKETAWSMVRMSHHKMAKRHKVTLSDQKASDLTRYDSRYVSYCARFEELDVLYKMLQGVLRTAGSDQEVISREITIRDIQIESEARARGINSGAPSRFAANADHARLPSVGRRSVPDFDSDDEDEDEDGKKRSKEDSDDARPKDRTPSKIQGKFQRFKGNKDKKTPSIQRRLERGVTKK